MREMTLSQNTTLIVFLACLCANAVTAGKKLYVDLQTGAASESASPQDGFQWLVQPSTGQCNNLNCDLQGVLKLTFDRNLRRRAQIDMTLARVVTGFSFNIGDSISNDAYGGDRSHQSNDAEIHSDGRKLLVFGSSSSRNSSSRLLLSEPYYLTSTLTINVTNAAFQADNGQRSLYVRSRKLFALNNQRDSQGQANDDVFLAMNRVIDHNFRSGTGLCSVEITWHS